jgi:phage tail-like protein
MKQIAALLCAVALCGSAFAQAPAAYKDGEDGVNRTRPGNTKWVEVNGVFVAGMHSSTDFNALREEAIRGQAHPENHKPGKMTTLVFTKDWSNTMEWYQWRKAVIDGKTDRRSVSIIFHDDSGVEVGRMNFYNCWPVKHTMPTADAKNSGHATETIELTYERFEWKGK